MNHIPLAPPVPSSKVARPAVSVIIPTYKRPHLVGFAVQSILSQDMTDFEVLVMDDWPEEPAEAAVREIGDSRVRYLKNPQNLGISGNLNRGIYESRGEAVFILHDSDLAKPTMVGEMYGLIQENPSTAYVHTGLEYIDDYGEVFQAHVGNYGRLTPGEIWLRRMLGMLASNVCAMTMAPRAMYESYGLLDSNYGAYADVEWSIRMCLYGDVGYLPEPLLVMRDREPDHPLRAFQWGTYDLHIPMRKKYIPLVRNPFWRNLVRGKLRWEIERALIINILSCLKHEQYQKLREGKKVLANYGIFVPKVVSAFIR